MSGTINAMQITLNLPLLHVAEQLDAWTGVWDATKKPNCCIQLPDTVFGNFSGSNVWNPNTKVSPEYAIVIQYYISWLVS